MSIPSASARYIITADDKTKSAIASIRNGFRSMESNVKATVSRINAAFGLIAGGVAAQAIRGALGETARGSKEFGYALDDVRRSARELLASNDGLPGATEAMKELAATLKDPAVVEAADKISSALIRGFAGAASGIAKATAGMQIFLGMTDDEVEGYRRQIDDLDRRIERARARGPRAAASVAALEAEKLRLSRQQMAAIEGRAPRRETEDLVDGGFGIMIPRRAVEAGDRATRRRETMRDLRQNIKWLEDLDKRVSNSDFFDELARKADIAGAKMRESFFATMDKGASDVSETLRRTGASIDEVGDKIGENIGVMSEWSVHADQAARNIQDSFADFLFDPFEDGVKGMLKSFLDVIRRMAAESAAAKIFGSKSSGGLGGLEFFAGIFSGLLGGGGKGVPADTSNWIGPRANGGPVRAGGLYRVNEKELEFFKPNVGGHVIPLSKMGGSMGGSPVNITTNIDARGATRELADVLPDILRRNNKDLEARIVQKMRRGQYGGE